MVNVHNFYVEVKKHGTHDQQSHAGGRGKGIGYKPDDDHPKYDFNSEDGPNVEYYTSSGYADINNYLRTNGKDDTQIKEYVSSMDKEISKTKAPRDMVLYRGTSGVNKFDRLKEGDVFTDKGFVSTTTEVGTVAEFMSSATGGAFDSRPFEKGYVLEMNVPKGNQVLSVNNYFKNVGSKYGPSADILRENEHILPRGSKFLVNSVKTINVRGVEDKLIQVTVLPND